MLGSLCLFGRPPDRVEPISPDQGAAPANRKPVAGELRSGSGIGGPHAGFGAQASALALSANPEIECGLRIAWLLEIHEVPRASEWDRASPDQPPELRDAAHDQLSIGLFGEQEKAAGKELIEERCQTIKRRLPARKESGRGPTDTHEDTEERNLRRSDLLDGLEYPLRSCADERRVNVGDVVCRQDSIEPHSAIIRAG